MYVAQGCGKLGSGQNVEFHVANGLSALAKTVQAEWAEIHGRFIDIHQDFDSAQFTKLVWQEWNDPNLSRNQVGWDQNLQRWEFERIFAPIFLRPSPPISERYAATLTANSDWFVQILDVAPSRLMCCSRV